ncbi:MAG TPA: YhcN/YlaJ family sporulation lipoprotein [Pseudobacillus sp.]
MIKLKHVITAFLPFVLLFGCNNTNSVDERQGVDIENARYNPPNNEDGNEMNNPNRPLTDGYNHNMTNNNDDNDNNDMEVSDQAESQLERLKEVRAAKVIVTDQTAYAAVMLNDGSQGKLTNQLENKIADEVRKTDRSVQKVYVSANPDFMQRMRGYGDQLNAGHPVTGLFDEFTKTVRRVFPDAR